MGKHLVDKELILRYYKGACTEEERALVLHWLNDDDDEVSFLEVEKMDLIESRIWQHIKPEQHKPFIKRKGLIWGGMAASVLLVLSLWVWQEMFIQAPTKMYHFGGNNPTSLDVQGLNFRLIGQGDATVVAKEGAEAGDLTFCGAIEIVNNSNSDVHYILSSACKNSKFTQKDITLKKGKTYIAMHNYYKTDEVIVLRKEHLIEFPDMVPSELRADLSI